MEALISPPYPATPLGGIPVKDTNYRLSQHIFCSGYGQYHTNSPDAVNRRPYEGITWQQVESMVENPPSVLKAEAQWAIFSNDYTEQARTAKHQRESGRFGALWVDIDEHCTKETLVNVISSLNCYAILYTTSSATNSKTKWRVLIPLAEPVGGESFELCQQVVNKYFDDKGITPDRKSETANQICYLPNKGQYYDYQVISHLPLFNTSLFELEINQIKNDHANKQQEREKKIESNRLVREELKAEGQYDLIELFNDEHPIVDLFNKYGYIKKDNRWLSPNSKSGNAGVSIFEDKNRWVSSHQSDFNIGKLKNGSVHGDAFDLFVFYEHKGDFKSALKSVGATFTTEDGLTINQAQQQAYRKQNRPTAEEMFADVVKATPAPIRAIDKLKGLSARGRSKDRGEQMLRDVFVLDRLAILGQATVIYAMPNTGKTLLVLKLVADSIENGRIRGETVFYINADDTFKGATTKLELAEKHGFEMLIPNEKGFEIKALVTLIREMVKEGSAKNKIIILDTLKKAVDLMDKKLASGFTDLIREFVGAGGTFIALAHTNKHRATDGRLIPQGTSDVRDDMDCVYVLDELSNQNGCKVVEFQNIKSRGNVSEKISYSYQKKEDDDWMNVFNSIETLDADKAKEIKKLSVIEQQFENDKEIVMAISQVLWNGKKVNRTELINTVKKQFTFSKKVITNVLDRYEGFEQKKRHQWASVTGDYNAKIYSLLTSTESPEKKSEEIVEEISFL